MGEQYSSSLKCNFLQIVKVTAAVVKNSLSQIPVKMLFLAGQPKKGHSGWKTAWHHLTVCAAQM